MAEYVERNKLIKRFCSHCVDNDKCKTDCFDIKIIKSIPGADVLPVVHGKWKYVPAEYPERGRYHCSICKTSALCNNWRDDVRSDYCPNCGARMDGKDNG